jgi:hypothetical protein
MTEIPLRGMSYMESLEVCRAKRELDDANFAKLLSLVLLNEVVLRTAAVDGRLEAGDLWSFAQSLSK